MKANELRRFGYAVLVMVVAIIGSVGLFSSMNQKGRYFEPYSSGGVTVYYKTNYGNGMEGFYGAGKVQQVLTEDAVSGKALKTTCKGRFSGPACKINVSGAKGLKLAFLAKGINYQAARLNVYDAKAGDNTTSYAYRLLPNETWVPVVYYLDRFRYNSASSGYVNQDTQYKEIRFFGPESVGSEAGILLDNLVVYRGTDTLPPEKIRDVRAEANDEAIVLTWEPAADNVAPMLYVIARARDSNKFGKVAETHQNFFIDRTAGKGHYRYRVLACDFENNLSVWSDSVEIRGRSATHTTVKTREEKDRLEYAKRIRHVHSKGLGKVRANHICMYGDSLTNARNYVLNTMASIGIYRVSGHGFNGTTTGWGRRNVVSKALEPENPEFLLVLFGTNDVRGLKRKREVYRKWVGNLEAIVKEAETRGTVVVLGTIPPRGFGDPLSEPEAEFNEAIIARAKALRIPVAYIFERVQEAGNRGNFIVNDGIHWTSQGMKVAAGAWTDTLKQVQFAVRMKN